MIDKLFLASKKAIEAKKYDKLVQIWPNYQIKRSPHYEQIFVFFEKNPIDQKPQHLVSVCSRPTEVNVPPLKIEINPSRNQSVFETFDILNKITPIKYLSVRRIDHAVDVQIPVETVFNHTFVPRKKSREVWRQNTLTGAYFGKYPERICIYDKARESNLNTVKTRIELQQWGEKVAIHSLDYLEYLATYCPFKQLRFLQKDSKQYSLEKSFWLSERVNQLGAQGAYKYLNKHGNFKRDYQKILGPPPDFPNLNELYQQNIRGFING